MTQAAALRSGKDHRAENFPVASLLVEAQFRAPILAFYNFVRTADDVADHPSLSAEEKIAILDRMEQTLLGQGDYEPEGVRLREILAERGLAPTHALDLLKAFRLDATKHRYESWDELVDYCRYSAMPVGRFVLDVHGEDRATWAFSDPLCAALQIINHLQDCKADYLNLDRVYLPLDLLAAKGASVEMLAADRARPSLRAAIDALCDNVVGLLQESARLCNEVHHARLGLEIAVIQRLAERLVAVLQSRDPLSERVHLSVTEQARFALLGLWRAGSRWVSGGGATSALTSNGAAADVPCPTPAADIAAGSSFYSAMRILPRGKREAIFAVYGFCRAVDDIADEPGAAPKRLAALEDWRGKIKALYRGESLPALKELETAITAFGLKRKDFIAVIDGMEMDVTSDIRAPDLETLDLYCDRVASAVGRLCVRIFGMDEESGIALSYHLGRALQLTNTLRDLDEDAAKGRLYLPRDFLHEAGIDSEEPMEVSADPRLGAVCQRVAARAFEHFAKADAIMSAQPRSQIRAPRIMGDAYHAILSRLVVRGFASPRMPIKLGRTQIAIILLRRFLW